MAILRRSLVLCLLVVAVRVQAQTPCVFSTTYTDKVVEECGSVGIGTADPAAKLHVKVDGQAEVRVEGSSTATGTGIRLLGDRAWKLGVNVGGVGTGKFNIFDVTSNVTRMAIDPNAGVSFGHQNPVTGLHLAGTGQATNQPVMTMSPAANHGATIFVQDTVNSANSGGMIAFGSPLGAFAAIKGILVDGSTNPLGGLVFNTRNAIGDNFLTERMRLHQNGRVSIGTTTDEAKLNAYDRMNITQTSNASNIGAMFRAYQNVTGGSGTGVSTAMQALSWKEGSGDFNQGVAQHVVAGVAPYATGTLTNAFGTYMQVGKGGGTLTNGWGIFLEDVLATNGYGIVQDGADDVNIFKGIVHIGAVTPAAGYQMQVKGDVQIDGTLSGTNIKAQYQDVAEWVPAQEDLAPGTVVVLDAAVSNSVVASVAAYDTTVAGVVSGQPGIILGEGGPAKEQIATTGRVKVKVDTSAGPIRIGDLLVTSSKPGHAMKSRPVNVGGTAMHRPGTILGKALEPLAAGEGEILVLLSLQ